MEQYYSESSYRNHVPEFKALQAQTAQSIVQLSGFRVSLSNVFPYRVEILSRNNHILAAIHPTYHLFCRAMCSCCLRRSGL